MCIHTLETWRPFSLYYLEACQRTICKLKGMGKGSLAHQSAPGSKTRVRNTSQGSGTIHNLQLMISWRYSRAAANSTKAQTAAPKHISGQYLGSPQLSWHGLDPVQHRRSGRKFQEEGDTKVASNLHFGSLPRVLQNKAHSGFFPSRSSEKVMCNDNSVRMQNEVCNKKDRG